MVSVEIQLSSSDLIILREEGESYVVLFPCFIYPVNVCTFIKLCDFWNRDEKRSWPLEEITVLYGVVSGREMRVQKKVQACVRVVESWHHASLNII